VGAYGHGDGNRQQKSEEAEETSAVLVLLVADTNTACRSEDRTRWSQRDAQKMGRGSLADAGKS